MRFIFFLFCFWSATTWIRLEIVLCQFLSLVAWRWNFDARTHCVCIWPKVQKRQMHFQRRCQEKKENRKTSNQRRPLFYWYCVLHCSGIKCLACFGEWETCIHNSWLLFMHKNNASLDGHTSRPRCRTRQKGIKIKTRNVDVEDLANLFSCKLVFVSAIAQPFNDRFSTFQTHFVRHAWLSFSLFFSFVASSSADRNTHALNYDKVVSMNCEWR